MSRIVINNISYNHPDGSNLFRNISFTCGNEKSGLTGNNGTGKSILAQIICNTLKPGEGNVYADGSIAYFPQDVSICNGRSLLSLFGISEKYNALHRILSGSGNDDDFATLDNDWDLEQNIKKSLRLTGIEYLQLDREFSTLSGGEKVRLVMSTMLFDTSKFLIFDEPTNHLDHEMRQFIYSFIQSHKNGMLVISHDRELLRLMDRIIELTPSHVSEYGGNYDFYVEQRAIEIKAIENSVTAADTVLASRVKKMELSLRRQTARTNSAKINAGDAGIPKIALHTLAGNSEKTFSKLKDQHEKRVLEGNENVDAAKAKLPENRKIKIDVKQNTLPADKKIVVCDNLNYAPDGKSMLWKDNLNEMIRGNERIHIQGKNGSGKSTLFRLITGSLAPSTGSIYIGIPTVHILDQEVSILSNDLSICENMIHHAKGVIPEYELRIRLARFLFFNDEVHKKAGMLSGGERMRAGMACMFAANQTPQLILLDEPTNNLDLTSIRQLTEMLQDYKGALLVVSHDKDFIYDIGIERNILLVR